MNFLKAAWICLRWKKFADKEEKRTLEHFGGFVQATIHELFFRNPYCVTPKQIVSADEALLEIKKIKRKIIKRELIKIK